VIRALASQNVFVIGGLVACAALFVFACGSSDDSDNTVYGLPDSGASPDADYCVSDFDCPPDGNGHEFACGFPIAQGCEARGVCVIVTGGATQCTSPNYCGCDGEYVTTCPLTNTSYVRGGPTNGGRPKLLADGGTSCGS
jgi:hypothetical protein